MTVSSDKYILKKYDFVFVFFIVLKLWTLMLRCSEDNSEEVRNHVWRLVNKDANCEKSFELFFFEFAKHYNKCPSAVIVALLYWSYLDVELPQDRSEVPHLIVHCCQYIINELIFDRDKYLTEGILVNSKNIPFDRIMHLTC